MAVGARRRRTVVKRGGRTVTGRRPAVREMGRKAQVIVVPRPLLIDPVSRRGDGIVAQPAGITGPGYAEQPRAMARRQGAIRKRGIRLRIDPRIVVIPSDFQGVRRREDRPAVAVAGVTGRRARIAAGKVRTVAPHLVAGARRKAVQSAVAIPALRQDRYRPYRVQGVADGVGNVLIGKVAARKEEDRCRRGHNDRMRVHGRTVFLRTGESPNSAKGLAWKPLPVKRNIRGVRRGPGGRARRTRTPSSPVEGPGLNREKRTIRSIDGRPDDEVGQPLFSHPAVPLLHQAGRQKDKRQITPGVDPEDR